MGGDQTSQYEGALLRDAVYRASVKGQFPMTDMIEHNIETAFHEKDYDLLRSYKKFLSINHLPWLINATQILLADLGVEQPSEVMTAEHLDTYNEISKSVFAVFVGAHSTSIDIATEFSMIAFSDMTMAPFIPEIIRTRQIISSTDLKVLLNEMRSSVTSLQEGAL